jgi:hypothetical protein
MTVPIPTLVGDVLIVASEKSSGCFSVGSVQEDGQQGLNKAPFLVVTSRAGAVHKARTVTAASGRIFVKETTGDWSELTAVLSAVPR